MEQSLKVLMISSDRNILQEGSAVSERMKEYGAMVGELHIVLLCDKIHTESLKIENWELKISDNVWVYPTNSSTSLLRPLGAAQIGKRVVREKGFVRGASLITTQDPFECGWAGRQVKRKWRLPLEVQLHTDPFSPYFSGFQNRARKFFARGVLASADSVRVVSESLAQKLRIENSKLKICVLPIYVDKDRIESTKLSFDAHARYPWRFIVLAVSRLSPEKDLTTAIQSMALLKQSFPDAGLLILGSGPEEGSLKALVKKLHLEGAVEFAGWQEDLASFYRSANAFLQTSLFEGYGLSLIEAGLSGLPVITTPVGIARELEPGKDVLFVAPQRPDMVAEALADLIEHNYIRENLHLNLLKTLETKLLSKEQYLSALATAWRKTATFAL